MRLNISRLIALLAVSSATFSCSGGQRLSAADFYAETTSVSIPAGGCSEDAPGVFAFTTANTWTARTSADVSGWFSFSPSSGAAGENEIRFVAAGNGGGQSRSATLTIVTGLTVKDITFTQEAPSSVGLYDDVPLGFVDEPESSGPDPSGTADLSLLGGMGHPRLLMNRADFDNLKKKVTDEVASNQTLGQLHRMIMTIADESAASTQELEYNYSSTSNRSLLTEARSALKRIGSCAYAYRMTDSQTKKALYLDRAERDLEAVLAFPDWDPDCFLDVAEMSFGVALGYDWLYYALPLDLRVKTRKALLERSVKGVRGHWSNTQNGNWNQICYGGTLAAAIAIYGKEREQCGGLINDIIVNNGNAVRNIYEPDGVYPEGYSYWSVGTGYQTVIFALLEKAFGTLYGMDAPKGLARTPEWMLMMVGVNDKSYCYGDSIGGTAVPKSGMWWFARHYNNPSLLRYEFYQMNRGYYKTTMAEMRFLPLTISCANDIENLDAAASSSKEGGGGFYAGIDGPVPLVLVRTEWSNSDTDRYLGIKGGHATSLHGHMDAGSFVYDALGCRWAEDVRRPDYTTIENALKEAGGDFWNVSQNSLRWQVWRLNNRGHGTLTINDRDHVADGFASIVEVYDSGSKAGAKLDMTAVFGDQVKSVYRTIVLEDGKDLHVTDEVTAREDLDADIQWRLLTSASVTVSSGMETLSQNGKTLCLRTTSSNPSVTPEFTTWPAQGTRSWDTLCDGVTVAGYVATVPKGATVTFETVLSADGGR